MNFRQLALAPAPISERDPHYDDPSVAPAISFLPERSPCLECRGDELELEALPVLDGQVDFLSEVAMLTGERHLEPGIAQGGCRLDEPVSMPV